MDLFEIVPKVPYQRKAGVDFWGFAYWVISGQKGATATLIKIFSCVKYLIATKFRELYQAWMVCPYLPQLFRVWPLQLCPVKHFIRSYWEICWYFYYKFRNYIAMLMSNMCLGWNRLKLKLILWNFITIRNT